MILKNSVRNPEIQKSGKSGKSVISGSPEFPYIYENKLHFGNRRCPGHKMTIVIFKRQKNPENPEKIRENPEFYYLKMIQNTQDTHLNRKKIQDTNYLEISRKVMLKKK